MTSGPTVSDGARELVGTVTRTYVSEPISLRQVREYIAATGRDPEAWTGQAADGRREPVPPLFFHAACRPVVAEHHLNTDGQYPFLGVRGVTGHTMAGGARYELLAPIYVGDVLTTVEELLSIEERVGRQGPLVLTKTRTSYTNQDGTLVAAYEQTIIFR